MTNSGASSRAEPVEKLKFVSSGGISGGGEVVAVSKIVGFVHTSGCGVRLG